MKKPFRAQDEASEELDHAARWYEERRSGLGHRFLASVDATLYQIQRFPRAGAPVPEVPQDLAVRQAPIKGFPYHVVYLETADIIHIWPSPTTSDDLLTGSREMTQAPSVAANGLRLSGGTGAAGDGR